MVNFGARETVPARFSDRLFHVHNPAVTLMRTSAEECRRLGEIISEKVNGATGPTTVVLPLGGVSALDAPGQPFHDPLADRELFESLRAGLRPDIPVVESEHHINDPEFADRIAATLIESMARTD
jgi:uncharacterized protein (UPF0261 family)